jgi:hypothetical protein
MTKHAINAFMALSVTFANELAALCEHVGADAKEVERGLKTESRIGPRAYLAPGAAFAGGTLARDVAFLTTLARDYALALPLLEAVRPSNERTSPGRGGASTNGSASWPARPSRYGVSRTSQEPIRCGGPPQSSCVWIWRRAVPRSSPGTRQFGRCPTPYGRSSRSRRVRTQPSVVRRRW